MTAFNEVLTAEQEAEKAIVAANGETLAVLAATETEQKNRLTAETTKLEQAEVAALAVQEKKVAEQVGKIEADTKTEVAAVTKSFMAKKSGLILALKKHF